MQCFNPGVTREIKIDGTTYLANDKYYLEEFSDWNPQIRDWLAERENIDLKTEHLYVIDFLRNSYGAQRKHPVLRMVTAELKHQFGTENFLRLYRDLYLQEIDKQWIDHLQRPFHNTSIGFPNHRQRLRRHRHAQRKGRPLRVPQKRRQDRGWSVDLLCQTQSPRTWW